MFLVLCVLVPKKNKLWLFSVKFIDMHPMYTVLSLILLVFEMLKIPKTKVEAHFLKKLDFVTNKCLAQDALRKCQRTTENFSKYTALQLSKYIVMCTNFLSSLIFYKAVPVKELYRLTRCISHISSP